MEERKINKKIIFSIVAVLVLVIVIAGATYAYFTAAKSTDIQTVQTGTLALDFENGDIVRGDDLMPISDAEINTKAAELAFTVTNVGDQHMNIEVALTDIEITDPLKHIDYRWGLFNADTGVAVSRGVFEDIGTNKEMLLIKDVVLDAPDPEAESNPYSTKNYILRIWIHDNGAPQDEMQGQTFSAKVTVDGEAVKYTDESCFVFDEETGTIESQYDYDDISLEHAYKVTDKCPSDVVIPRTINGVEVKTIGSSYDDQCDFNGISSIILPDTVTTINYEALACQGNVDIRIPENVTYIAEWGLSAKNIFLPDGIEFSGDTSLDVGNSHLTINTNNFSFGNFGYSTNSLKSIVFMDGLETLDISGSGYVYDITSIEVPASVKKITISDFELNSFPNLKEIVIRGKSSLDDFDNTYGLDQLPESVNIVFRP